LINNGYAVGIDFGTSNTVALIRWPDGRTRAVLFDGQPILASAVYLDDRGVTHVGRDAQRMALIDPARYEPNPKRRIDEGRVLLGDRELPVPDLLAAPLARVARAVREAIGHLPRAVLTCPVAWGQTRRATLLDAAARAGWRGTELVYEPVAAARYLVVTLGKPVPPGGVLAVFDFGGGTLDLALIRNDNGALSVVGTGGSESLGGVDFDAALVGHLGGLLSQRHPAVWAQITRPADALARRHRQTFWDDVRSAKEMLSRSTVAPVPIPGVDAALHLTRDELERVALPLAQHAVAELQATLDRAGLTREALCGVFLVGGASRVPLVSRLLHVHLGLAPTVPDQPELPVAEGALLVSARAAPPPRPLPPPPPGPPPPGPLPPVARPRPRGLSRPLILVPLIVLSLVAAAGAVVYYALKPQPSFQAAEQERVTRIDNLAPDGLRQSLLSETKAYAVGEQADGTIAIVTVDLKTGTEVRHQPAKAARWQRAELLGNWVVVTSAPGADGKVTMAFANGSDNIQARHVLGKDDLVIPRFADADTPTLSLFVISGTEPTRTIRSVTIGEDGVRPGEGHTLRPGMRPANRNGPEPGLNLLINLVDDEGKLYKYTGFTEPEEETGLQPLPKGISPALFYWTGVDEPWTVDTKLEYRLSQGVGLDMRGPADRRAVWIGPCGRRADAVRLDDYYTCVVDEIPDRPDTRMLAVYRESLEPVRAPVPYAQPGDGLVETGGYLLVPTRSGYVTVSPDGDTQTFSGRLWDTGYRAVIHLPAVATAAAATQITGIDLGDNLRTDVGAPAVRSAGCTAHANRLACPGANDFTVWLVRTKLL
jgi:actin-like ATPase involved in cell morphogenesis